MPTKKATRSTRSTRTTKATSKAPSSSSEIVLDENVDTQSEVVETKKKSTKSTSASKKVLGERNAPNNHVSSPSKESSKSQSASHKSSKSKKTKKAVSEEDPDSRATTPVPTSPTKKRLPEELVQTYLSNYDLDAQSNISKLRAHLDVTLHNAIARMQIAITSIPRAVRELTLADFIDNYGADIHNFMNNAPVQHLKESQEEWDQIREERSPAKAKRVKKDDGRTSRTVAKKKTTRGTRNAPTSPPPSSSSSKPAPSLSKFQPSLPKEALQTPKPRMARPGEMIQWQSINGSPICGVIGEDGRVVPVTF